MAMKRADVKSVTLADIQKVSGAGQVVGSVEVAAQKKGDARLEKLEKSADKRADKSIKKNMKKLEKFEKA